MRTLARAQENCCLLTNGLGGYTSVSAAFSVSRSDQGILIGTQREPDKRIMLVHRLSEQLDIGTEGVILSTQEFSDGREPEEGFRHLTSFVWENGPHWLYEVQGVQIERYIALEHGTNTAAVVYSVYNRSGKPCTLHITPYVTFCPKGQVLEKAKKLLWDGTAITCEENKLYLSSDGEIVETETVSEALYYADDAKDGRSKSGLALSCVGMKKHIPVGETVQLSMVFSMQPIVTTGMTLLEQQRHRLQWLEESAPFHDPVAKQLACSTDAFLSHRASTGGKTILAGFPFFGDWGRDTMIALSGCTLATGNYTDAKSILQTFLAYEKDGLVPNLFPDGAEKPRYNTVDAALLLINCMWLYHRKTEDTAFVQQAFPVLKRMISAYQHGTRHGICMDTDGLIQAGEGMDQVTWMDVCVDGILPTPRQGKPVEINAYWYNALCIMQRFAEILGQDGTEYACLAQKAKASFLEKFWLPEQGYLKDVLSDTEADMQLRCSQIWAVTMPFTMLSPEQEKQVVDTVYRELYTPCGLRTLSPKDAEFHPFYGGEQKQRDLAYHQGTVWVFPLGAYYQAYLKVHGYTKQAAAQVRRQLEAIEPMLREGCIGQLPEIYDGDMPSASKGCFAQAWSVGELLCVYETLEQLEQES